MSLKRRRDDDDGPGWRSAPRAASRSVSGSSRASSHDEPSIGEPDSLSLSTLDQFIGRYARGLFSPTEPPPKPLELVHQDSAVASPDAPSPSTLIDFFRAHGFLPAPDRPLAPSTDATRASQCV